MKVFFKRLRKPRGACDLFFAIVNVTINYFHWLTLRDCQILLAVEIQFWLAFACALDQSIESQTQTQTLFVFGKIGRSELVLAKKNTHPRVNRKFFILKFPIRNAIGKINHTNLRSSNIGSSKQFIKEKITRCRSQQNGNATVLQQSQEGIHCLFCYNL